MAIEKDIIDFAQIIEVTDNRQLVIFKLDRELTLDAAGKLTEYIERVLSPMGFDVLILPNCFESITVETKEEDET